MSILGFPKGMTPRPGQIEVLQTIEANWDKYDVFVIVAPTAFGKTAVGRTLLSWGKLKTKSAGYLTPTNLLVDQFTDSFPDIHAMHRKGWYRCPYHPDDTVESIKKLQGCKCRDCPYEVARRKSYAVPEIVSNNHLLISHGFYKGTMVFDEAHNLIPLLQDQHHKKLWFKRYNIPYYAATYGKLLQWVKAQTELLEKDKKFRLLHDELEFCKHQYIISRQEGVLRGKEETMIKLTPVDLAEAADKFFKLHKKTKKLILMSATIGRSDLKTLGLNKQKVKYIEAASPIPADRRPIFVENLVSVSYYNQDRAVGVLAEFVRGKLHDPDYAEVKGLIHAPYSLAAKLAHELRHEPRILSHTRDDKMQVYQKFRASPEPLVLLASGLEEGIDLPYDAGRWQVICKVPYLSLAEPAIKYRADEDPEWYNWEAAKKIEQAAGRICRAPDDYGETFILDSSFSRIRSGSLHAWFKEALVISG